VVELRIVHLLGRLYHLCHSASPFCSAYFWHRVSLYALLGLDHHPPICASRVAGMTGMCHWTQPLWGSDFPNLCLLSSWDYRHELPCLSLKHFNRCKFRKALLPLWAVTGSLSTFWQITFQDDLASRCQRGDQSAGHLALRPALPSTWVVAEVPA
jgi:hypothetical protein